MKDYIFKFLLDSELKPNINYLGTNDDVTVRHSRLRDHNFTLSFYNDWVPILSYFIIKYDCSQYD
jgi:hypothetical protein